MGALNVGKKKGAVNTAPFLDREEEGY